METLQNQINQYKEKNNIKNIVLYILTPCYGGVVHVNYTYTLIKTIELCRQLNIKVITEFTKNESLVQRARNQLIAKAMYNKETTHILFIDSDITWAPVDIINLILHDKELVGGIYPFKTYYLDKLNDEVEMNKIKEKYENSIHQTLPYLEFLKQNLLKFNLNFVGGEQRITKNLLPIRHLATGFMMIRRSCIEKMMEHYAHTKYDCDTGQLMGEENKFCYALFDCYIKDGHYYSEDWGFCDRWTDIGGEIFTDITISLGHSGMTDYYGRVLSTLEIK
jgi:hypothetical protein